MFWKHRNLIGMILLVVAALLWSAGWETIHSSYDAPVETTEYRWEHPSTVVTEESMYPTTVMTSVTSPMMDPPSDSIDSDTVIHDERGHRGFGIAFCVIAALTALCGIFVTAQREMILGPDGLAALWFIGSWGYSYLLYSIGGLHPFYGRFMVVFLLLLSLRILWGWTMQRFSTEQCLLRRTSNRLSGEEFILLRSLGWILLSVVALWIYDSADGYPHYWMTYCAGGVTVIFGLFFLLKYIREFQHFRKQLEHYRKGEPIAVEPGTFTQTEKQLLAIRKEHEEAVRTAVVGERFKVELIANVSHDLRTPLTSILGYSELLEKEELSPKGREQLMRLRDKSVYMNELVESLFELTKVESGVIEPKRECIDILRLLEQTVGFLDDRLQAASLEVRRQYAVDSLSVISDGRLLHQVFANLLGNAIKYAHPGTRIYLELKEDDDSARVRIVNTANYDMDFSEEEILERFARGDKARSTKGSGIGLAIAKTYTEAVGGTFRVKVDGDQFSAFVTLPKN